MKLLFKQRFFSWFDSFDVFDEKGAVYFRVEGCLSWGHMFKIYDSKGSEIATLKEEILTFLPRFSIYMDGNYRGCVRSELSFFVPRLRVEIGGYDVIGDFYQWNYAITKNGRTVATISKQIFNFTDTYLIDANDTEELIALLVTLAIDAIKCRRNN